ncbi:3-deoxy-D-manno-octulosonic acid transferase [Lacimicrobium alkaliphilum]|uniref:3-deoxy-D-manno-octulosonic acid transferase n=2 Tax=Lacimicrobium alkaliphilum TaxID=1526571 RepID=A0ABQ1RSJ2_9ALTE|nr:3-deoxy-D-manno-octulosonic acid transferase [Lacimicrobium alkaliphilum]
MFLSLYTLLWILLTPVLTVVMLRRGHNSSTQELRRLPERFGFGPAVQHTGGYLFHCVSVGEVVAAAPLIKQLKTLRPDSTITVTTTTSTGSERLLALFGNTVQHCYLPFDMPFTMNKLLKRLKPERLVIVEVELWPNMIDLCWSREIPVTVINARMTNRSASRYQKLRWLAIPMLKKLSKVCAQGQRDYENYLKLGVAEDKIILTNNIKFDLPDVDVATLRHQVTRTYATDAHKVIVAGSTHAPEEELLLETYQQLKHEYPQLLLVLVPRHPQRFEQVFQLCQHQNMKVVRSSTSAQCQTDTDILLADQMGILRQLYAMADIVFVGGSLSDRGGHNALEPAQLGIPIIMGPSQYNNPQICSTLEAGGALCTVRDETDLVNQCRNWLKEPEAAKRKGLSGQHTIAENAGALQATLKILITS